MHSNTLPQTRYNVHETVTVKRTRNCPRRSDAVASCNIVKTDSKKTVVISRCGAPYRSSKTKYICRPLEESCSQHEIIV